MIIRRPGSTLFPYTTLFRSFVVEHANRLDHIIQCDGLRCSHHHGTSDLVRLQQDRKSTRLNSSHVRISYAVFCLKKKKKPGLAHPPHPGAENIQVHDDRMDK